MSVQSINNRVQTSAAVVNQASGGQASSGSTVEAAFLSALQSSLSFASPSLLPSLSAALSTPTPAAPPPPEPQVQQQPVQQQAPQQAQPTQAPQHNTTSQSDNTQTQQSASQQSGDSGQQSQQGAPAATHQAASTSQSSGQQTGSAAPAKTDDDAKTAGNDTANQVSDAVQSQIAAAQIQLVPLQQSTAPQVVETVAQTAAPTGQPVAVDPDDDKVAAETVQQNATAGQSANADAAAPKFADLMAAQQTDAPVAAAPTAADQGSSAPTAGQHGISAALTQQKDDLAQMLAGTGASVAIQVQTSQTAQSTATTAQGTAQVFAKTDDAGPALAAAPVIDPSVAVAAAATQTASQNSSGEQSGNNAAAATTDTMGLNASQIPQIADAKTFAAALAAQIDTDAPVQASGATQSTPTGQPVGGIATAQAPQAADKAAAPQAPQAPRQSSQLTQQQVVDQIKVQIAKQGTDGTDTIKIQLKPLDLGRIEIKLEVGHDGQVSASVTADNKDTLAMLQKDSSGLSKALTDAGLKPESGSLSFNLRGDAQQQQQQQQTAANQSGNQNGGQGGNQDGSSGRSRRLLSSLDTGSTSALSPTTASGGRSGVNISV